MTIKYDLDTETSLMNFTIHMKPVEAWKTEKRLAQFLLWIRLNLVFILGGTKSQYLA